MPEVAGFVNHGASLITPAVVDRVLHDLPMWKVEFTQIKSPQYPHLVDQLEFLADAVEDAAEGIYRELPYYAMVQAVFVLIYAHKKLNMISGITPAPGSVDDSSVVRAALLQIEKAFARYAEHRRVPWAKVSIRA